MKTVMDFFNTTIAGIIYRILSFGSNNSDFFIINPKGINGGQLEFSEFDLQQFQCFQQLLAKIS